MVNRPYFVKQIFLMIMVCFLLSFSVHAQMFTSFKFSAPSLGWDINEEDFEGIIDNDNLTITFTTQRWIDDITHLTALFEIADTDDCDEVKIGDAVQESGVTENDFSKDIVYSLCGDAQYTVHFISPQATGIPVIKIETQGGVEVTSKDNWTNMTTFTLIDPNDDSNNISFGNYGSQYHRIRGRGNTTWTYPKKPYRVRFREDISLFGKAARENWVLLAEYLDPTFLTTAVAFKLGESVFQMPFTCTYQPVHVYYNGRYDGLYTLTEHRQADPEGPPGAPGRVGIVETNGGWFVEMDEYYDEDPKFRTDNLELPVMIKSPEYAPDPEDSDNPFYDFIKNDMNQLCDSMVSLNFPENGYRDLLDMNAFVDFLMVNELVMNTEIGHYNATDGKRYPKSCFVYKIDQDEKICMGPLWDFDWAFSFTGIQHNYFSTFGGRLNLPPFFLRLFDDPVFVAKYKERWNEKYNEIVAIADYIDTQGETIRTAALEDAKRWFIPGGYRDEYDPDHAQQVVIMKDWWKNRVSWLNTNSTINKIEAIPVSKDFGTVLFDNDYSFPPQTIAIVAYGILDNITAALKEGDASGYEILTTDIQAQTTGKGGYYASVSIRLKDGLPLGEYNDELIFSGKHLGNDFSISVPVRFAVTKYEQDKFEIDAVDDKVFGDDNFILSTTGGSGNGAVTFEVIAGNATIDANTGEIEITGAGDIIVQATKAEDDEYQPAQAGLIITVAKAIPSFTTPTGLYAAYGDYLLSVKLPENWEWEDSTIVISNAENTQIYKAFYTPADTTNYTIVHNVEISISVGPTGISELSEPNPLQAWMRNGSLHVTGITPGETLSIYSITGTLVYRCIATSDVMDIPLRTRGIYVLKIGNHALKIVNYELRLRK